MYANPARSGTVLDVLGEDGSTACKAVPMVRLVMQRADDVRNGVGFHGGVKRKCSQADDALAAGVRIPQARVRVVAPASAHALVVLSLSMSMLPSRCPSATQRHVNPSLRWCQALASHVLVLAISSLVCRLSNLDFALSMNLSDELFGDVPLAAVQALTNIAGMLGHMA